MDSQSRPWTADSGQDGNEAGRLSANSAATLLGVSQRTIRRAIARGDLPAVKHAGTYQIDPTDLTRYLARRRTSAPPLVRTAPDPPRLISLPRRPVQTVPPLPRPLTPLIGREREAAAIANLLRRDHDDRQDPEGHDPPRLVTLIGPGGVGKTRLAIRVAGDLATAFADGIRFVPLAGVSDPERVADAVARALGSTHVPGSSVQTVLVAALREAETLLVLDNFEHVLAAAPLVTDLLAACPRLVVLVTSRTMLRVSGERAFPVPPLDVPTPSEATDLEDMARTPAVRLFAARAGNVAPSFALTAATVPIVADICRRLDGLPLAIELAAARANFLPVGTMRDRLERRLALLTGGPRDASPRHRTMHDAIAWSYDLLTQEEQVTFRRLAVFAGGFSLEAAEAVAGGEAGRRGGGKEQTAVSPPQGDSPVPLGPSGLSPSSFPPSRLPASPPSVLDLIGSLVDKSLVRREVLESEARFFMLETIREFAVEQLEASGENETTHQAHAAFFLDFAEQHAVAPFLPDDGPRLAELAAEDANLRAAMAWLAARGEGPEGSDLARLVAALGWYWFIRGYIQDEHVWFERVLAHAAAPDMVRARISLAFGLTLLMRGEIRPAGHWLHESLALARAAGEPLGATQALIGLGVAATAEQEYDRATDHFEEALALAPSVDDPRFATTLASAALANHGVAARGQGRLAAAAADHEAALAGQRAVGFVRAEARSLLDLGEVAREQGDLAQAFASQREGLMLAWEHGETRVVVEALEGIASTAVEAERTATAVRLFGAAERLRELTGLTQRFPVDHATYEQAVAAARVALGEHQFQRNWNEGRGLPLAAAIAEVQSLAPSADDGAGDDPNSTLSPRQVEILRLLAAGKTDPQIAATLFISVRTVERHVGAILARLGVPTRTAAVVAAIAAGLVPTPDAPPPALHR